MINSSIAYDREKNKKGIPVFWFASGLRTTYYIIRQAIDICKDYCTNTCYCIHLEYVSDEFIDDVDGTVKLALLE